MIHSDDPDGLPCLAVKFRSQNILVSKHVVLIWLWVKTLYPLVNIKIAGKWMFIPLKMVLIGIDPYPYLSTNCLAPCHLRSQLSFNDDPRQVTRPVSSWIPSLLAQAHPLQIPGVDGRWVHRGQEKANMSHPWTKISLDLRGVWKDNKMALKVCLRVGILQIRTSTTNGHPISSDHVEWWWTNKFGSTMGVPFRWTHNEPWKGPHLSVCSYLAWQAKHVVFDKRRYAVRLFLSFHQINGRNTMKYVEMNKCSKISKFNTEAACSGWFSRHITRVQTSWKKGAV